MLPRHLQSLVRANAHARTRNFLAVNTQRRIPLPAHALYAAGFHSSSRRQNELPKSPFQTFVDVLRDEIRKNRELQDNVKQLQGDVQQFQDSEAMKRAREMYERARLTSSIKENPRLRAAAEELQKAGVKLGDAVGEALRTMEESELMRAINKATTAVSSTIATTTEPIRNTAAYKVFADTIVDALDDSGTAKHGGYEEKETRRQRRQARLAKAGVQGIGVDAANAKTKANPEAGSSLVVHKDSPRQEAWNRLKETNPLFVKMGEWKTAFNESENPFVSGVRGVTDSVKGFFEENETAQVMRLMKAMDPSFRMEVFERELREYIVPEVVDAYLSADQESLKAWCSEATYNVLWATMEHYLKQGLISDSRVLDIRQVDVTAGKLLDSPAATAEQIPVWVVTFATQEVMMFRNVKTTEVVVGAEDRVEQCHYAAVLTRVEEEVEDEVTGGWKVIEMARRSARAYL